MDCMVETTGNVTVYIRGEHGHLPRAERGFFEPAPVVGMSDDEGVVIAGKREVGEHLKWYSGITPHIDVTHALPLLLPSLEQALLGQGLSVTTIRQAAGDKLVIFGEYTVANLHVQVFFAVLCLFVSGSDRLSRSRIRLQMATF